ncbi:hypothetical protein GCM10007100_05950 [Roseibacillus persicicus]|uniref:Uncharacterized protein n=1 Tax=Roseibacillus persicicus TaxID=454148 RepID=A0A918TF50_9BACT|nr:hypothetical protein GCM10007100_05950 [Roseibacillus persicicus]
MRWDTQFNLDILEEKGRKPIVSEFFTTEEGTSFLAPSMIRDFFSLPIPYDLNARAFLESTARCRKVKGNWTAFMGGLTPVPPAL